MKRLLCEDYAHLSKIAAEEIADQLCNKPDSVLGFATGSTPLGMYEELVKMYNDGTVDFSKARAFNLDEYYPIKQNHPQSYYTYMVDNFVSKTNLTDFNIPCGEAGDPHVEAANYETKITAAGGIDLQVLGVGLNGHIAFNEPADVYSLDTHFVELAESTVQANSRFFSEGEVQPKTAISMGIGTIFKARRIIMLICGRSKADIATILLEGKIRPEYPATLLLLHNDFTVLIDREAAGK